MTQQERFHMRATLAWWFLLLAGSMGLMLWTAAHKAIVISDVSHDQKMFESVDAVPEQARKLSLRSTQSKEHFFLIPLGKNVKAEDVAVENGYIDRELRVFIKSDETDLYETEPVCGDVSHITVASLERQGSGILLKMQMDAIYEFRSSMEDGMLKIEMFDPHELYKVIVVIDPSGGGQQTGVSSEGQTEKDIALQVSRAVQKRWQNPNIRLVFTRTEDVDLSMERRAKLVEDVGADLFLNLSVLADADQKKYGICGWYNDQYFIPEFGNVQMADILVRNVTIAGGNRAVGLEAAGEDSILQMLTVPAARVGLGYLTNEQERGLLVQEGYQEKLAEGIVKAIEEVCEAYYE